MAAELLEDAGDIILPEGIQNIDLEKLTDEDKARMERMERMLLLRLAVLNRDYEQTLKATRDVEIQDEQETIGNGPLNDPESQDYHRVCDDDEKEQDESYAATCESLSAPEAMLTNAVADVQAKDAISTSHSIGGEASLSAEQVLLITESMKHIDLPTPDWAKDLSDDNFMDVVARTMQQLRF